MTRKYETLLCRGWLAKQPPCAVAWLLLLGSRLREASPRTSPAIAATESADDLATVEMADDRVVSTRVRRPKQRVLPQTLQSTTPRRTAIKRYARQLTQTRNPVILDKRRSRETNFYPILVANVLSPIAYRSISRRNLTHPYSNSVTEQQPQ
jgi:hypothetical protein